MPPTTQAALTPSQSWLDVLAGSGVRAQAASEADALAGRNTALAQLWGRINPSMLGIEGGGYLNTLGRDQLDATLGEAKRGYALDVARFGLAQADLNYRQRATEAQNRLQEMALQVSQRGPANAIGYNYLLGNRAAPTGTERSIQPSGVSQPSNIQVPPEPTAAVDPYALLAQRGLDRNGNPVPTAPAPAAAPAAPAAPPAPAAPWNPSQGVPPGFTQAPWNPSQGVPPGFTQQETPALAHGGIVVPPDAEMMPMDGGAVPPSSAMPPSMPQQPDSPVAHASDPSWLDGYAKGMQAAGMRGGDEGAAQAVVGDSVSGQRTGHEEVATAVPTSDPQRPALAVQPIPDGQPLPPMRRAAAGGFIDTGMSGGTQNTMYSPRDFANTPAVRQATGKEATPRFGAFAGSTTIPGTETQIPFGAQQNYTTLQDMQPSSRALLESIVSTPRDQGGLGLEWADFLESSRRGAPLGRRYATASYGA